MMEPQFFFETVCPRVLSARRAAAARFGGRVAFVASGEGGGSWSLDLDRAKVLRGREGAQVVMSMPSRDLAALLGGALDLPAAVREGRCRIEGDRSKLSVLSILFRP